MSSGDVVRAHVVVPLEPAAAFAAWVALDDWWPAEFTWSNRALQGLVLDPREGGLCSEHGPDGFRCDWGRVRVWAPPERLVLGWHISPSRAPEPDPERASEVELGFAAVSGGSRVTVEHREFARHGEEGAAYRDGMAQGWPVLLDAYVAAASGA